MSATDAPDLCPIEPRPDDYGRYAAFETASGDTVVYDAEAEGEAWVQAEFAMPLDSML